MRRLAAHFQRAANVVDDLTTNVLNLETKSQSVITDSGFAKAERDGYTLHATQMIMESETFRVELAAFKDAAREKNEEIECWADDDEREKMQNKIVNDKMASIPSESTIQEWA